jgi:Uma2 family endonuclease
MEELIAAILARPEAPLIVEQAQARLEEERQKRLAFYEEIDEDTKAEFINGEVYYHSPVKKEHNDVGVALCGLLNNYVIVHQLGYVGYDKIMVTFPRNDYEPDICFFDQDKAQHFVEGQMHFPVPDLAVEILSSNVQHDRKVKFEDYQAHGVVEYWIIDPVAKTLEQYVLENQMYQLRLKASEGHVRSVAVVGFEILISAIFDEKLYLEELRRILQ